MGRQSKRLVVVSHVRHYLQGRDLFAYTPYVAELDEWAALFGEVVIVSPTAVEHPPADCSKFRSSNVTMVAVPLTGGTSWAAKLRQVAYLPVLCTVLLREIRKGDVVHVRCPGNLGLLGALLAPLSKRPRIAKYAGNWGDYPGESRSYRWQRRILASKWWSAPVTVYSKQTNDPDHVINSFSSAITTEQAERGAAAAATRRRSHGRLRLLYVGRLTAPKHPEVIVRSIAELRGYGIDATGTILGDGPEFSALVELSRQMGIEQSVSFAGAVPLESVLSAYEEHDSLVLASESEGFPKAVVEAMCFGLVVVGSARGRLVDILGEGRGFTVPVGDSAAVAAILRDIALDPEGSDQVGARASAWSTDYTLGELRSAIATIIQQWWPGEQLVGPLDEGRSTDSTVGL